jgi:endonuclease/exonuclease/phosphatase family metal-dependent hydrolase/S1-C subfamily serine protease
VATKKKKAVTGKGRSPQSPDSASIGDSKITIAELRAMMYDLDTPDGAIRPYLKIDDTRSNAFAPVATIDEAQVDTEGEEAAVALGMFNGLSRWRRQMRYRRKIRDGFRGIRIVSEGDSWFQYPWLLEDVIDHLFEEDEYAILSLGAAGDELHEMLLKDEFRGAIRDEQPLLFLISGGGNDLFGDGRLASMLHPQAGRPEDYPNENFTQLLSRITRSYRQLFANLTRDFNNLRILCHGYDYAIPADGRWLGEPMGSIGITDKGLQKDIMRVIVDRFSGSLADAADDFPNVHFVDCRNVVGDRWNDELHPTDEGFADVAERFRTAISAVTTIPRRETRVRNPLSPGRDARIDNASDLPKDTFRRLVARRARVLGIDETGVINSDESRRQVETEISRFFEKVNLGKDFLPARYLRDGAHRARAVCRIRTPGSLGTGFFIASRGFIMTNNHVLPSVDVARGSVAESGFEDGLDVTRVAFLPDRFFVTDSALDFTIVACEENSLPDVEAVPLLRDPATVTRGEAVNIIQHPRGRPKEIAIHNNDVLRVLDRVIRYSTDTEPGSSGSPVFNNSWQLVALHHAGWSAGGGRATNEGIRLSAIVAHLLGERMRGTESSSALSELLGLVPDSSPYLGFFDIEGVEGDGTEVEVPDFQGVPDFADVGFWNIEHFNAFVDDTRIERVADVVGRLSMDVLGLVEVEEPALERLVQALRDRGDDMAFELLDVGGRQDLAVIYDRDTAVAELVPDIAERNREHLEIKTTGGKKAFPRAPLFARCLVAAGNAEPVEFILIVVHLKAFGDATSRERRRLAALSLAAIIEDIRNTEQLPVILGGDFNQTINNDVLSALTTSPDLFALTSDDADTNAASFIGGSRRSLIDHIMVSGDVRPGVIQGDDAAIVRLDRRVRDFSDTVSDHVPIVMRVVSRSIPLDVTRPEGPGVSAVISGDVREGHAQLDIPEGVHTLTVRLEEG